MFSQTEVQTAVALDHMIFLFWLTFGQDKSHCIDLSSLLPLTCCRHGNQNRVGLLVC